MVGDELEVGAEPALDLLAGAGGVGRRLGDGLASCAPISPSSCRYRSRFEAKCWYSTGLVTPAASATSFIDVEWKPFFANTSHRGVDELLSTFGSRESHTCAASYHPVTIGGPPADPAAPDATPWCDGRIGWG